MTKLLGVTAYEGGQSVVKAQAGPVPIRTTSVVTLAVEPVGTDGGTFTALPREVPKRAGACSQAETQPHGRGVGKRRLLPPSGVYGSLPSRRLQSTSGSSQLALGG
jgi:hypothetical protein